MFVFVSCEEEDWNAYGLDPIWYNSTDVEYKPEIKKNAELDNLILKDSLKTTQSESVLKNKDYEDK